MGLFNDVEADLTAINEYFNREKAKTTAAGKLKSAWYMWYNNLSWFDKQQESTAQQAINRKNAFAVANVTSQAEAVATKDILGRGMTREEAKGKTRVADSAGNYSKQKGITVASAAKGTVPKGARPTIRRGSTGEAVKSWQHILAITVDGIFGPGTEAATKAFQRKHGLVEDGVVGTNTWSAAIGDMTPMQFEKAAVTPVAPTTTPAKKVPTGVVASIGSLQQKPTRKKKGTTRGSSTKVKKAASKRAKQTKKPPSSQIKSDDLALGISLEKVPLWAKIGAGFIAVGSAIGLAATVAFGVHEHKKGR